MRTALSADTDHAYWAHVLDWGSVSPAFRVLMIMIALLACAVSRVPTCLVIIIIVCRFARLSCESKASCCWHAASNY